jgi:hypothetical protein
MAAEALDLVKPPDQPDAVAPRAAGEVRDGCRIAIRAQQHLMLGDQPLTPWARLARFRV